MNELTKEELQILKSALYFYERKLHGNDSPNSFTALLKIIASMLDNKCHEEANSKLLDYVYEKAKESNPEYCHVPGIRLRKENEK